MNIEPKRHNPDDLLRRIKQDEESSDNPKGRLKIFFGYAAGVGKTYAMLEAAQRAKGKGFDVVAGYIEPHQRPETSALLDGLEQIPPLTVKHKGILLHEFDLDATLQRHPRIVLVDELAHTNADGCRHRKRYQDVEELLRAGISVYTTVNVQHIESLNDKVAGITQVPVFERVPDRIFDQASAVELIDIEPEDLMDRLNAGKVYRSEQAKEALSNFFTKKNLAALREIALRRTADRLNRNPDAAGLGIGDFSSGAGEDVLVYVTGSPGDVKAIRSAAGMAQAYHGDLTALVVEGSSRARGEKGLAEDHRGLRSNVKLAEELGATVVAVYGEEPMAQIAQYAPSAGISHVVLGSSCNVREFWGMGKTQLDKLADLAPSLSITAVPDKNVPKQVSRRSLGPLFGFSWRDVCIAIAGQIIALLVGLVIYEINLGSSVTPMLFLLASIVLARAATTISYSLVAAIAGMLLYNFFFTYPKFTLFAEGASYPIVFACLILGGFVVSTLTIRMRMQAENAALRAYRTEVLIDSNRRLREAKTATECLAVAAGQAMKLLNRSVVMYLSDEKGRVGEPRVFDLPGTDGVEGGISNLTEERERAVASWVASNGEPAGATTNTLADSKCLYMPIRGQSSVRGVAGLALSGDDDFGSFEKSLLLVILEETGQTIERILLFQESQEMHVKAETESLRSNMLRSVSHDLRTPLTSISGNSSILLNDGDKLSEETRNRLYRDIRDDAIWLINLIENILAVTRAEEGRLDLNLQTEIIADVVEEAVRHAERHAGGHSIEVLFEDDFLMAEMDVNLIVQVLTNLLGNAINYTPDGSTIKVTVRRQGKNALISVADNGPGIKDSEKPSVFDLFYNGSHLRGDHRRGLGLGLALCKSIVKEHGGEIGLEDAAPHGCVFWFTLPAVEAHHLPERI